MSYFPPGIIFLYSSSQVAVVESYLLRWEGLGLKQLAWMPFCLLQKQHRNSRSTNKNGGGGGKAHNYREHCLNYLPFMQVFLAGLTGAEDSCAHEDIGVSLHPDSFITHINYFENCYILNSLWSSAIFIAKGFSHTPNLIIAKQGIAAEQTFENTVH